MNLRFSDHVEKILRNIGSRKATRYVEDLVEEADRAWRMSLAELRGRGWHANELLAACDALNGTWLLDELSGHPVAVALELHDAQRLNNMAGKWDIEPDRWSALVLEVRERPEIAQALRVLVREFWRNDAVEQVVRG